MPKRTNAFQKLVHLLHEQLSPLASVTESKLLHDSAAKILREVDVVIEFRNGEKVHIVGIECRDHRSKQDVIWVESVVTKHRDLRLDESVLVSATPFSNAAEQKAAAHGVTLVSMAEALKSDWTLLLGDTSTLWWAEWNAVITSVEAKLNNGYTAPVGPGLIAYTADGEAIGELGALLNQRLSEVNVLEKIRPEQKGSGEVALYPSPSVWIRDTNGVDWEVREFKVYFTWKTPSRVPIPLRKGRLLNKPVAFGVGIASESQGGPADGTSPKDDTKTIEVHFIKTSETEAISVARVLHPGGTVEQARMTPVISQSGKGD